MTEAVTVAERLEADTSGDVHAGASRTSVISRPRSARHANRLPNLGALVTNADCSAARPIDVVAHEVPGSVAIRNDTELPPSSIDYSGRQYARVQLRPADSTQSARIDPCWMTYLWSYRRFALREPHLYAVMFGPGLAAFRLGDPADLEAARSTFVSLLRRIHACVNGGRWEVDDVTTAGEAVWSGVHGHTTLEHTGFFGAVGRDPVRSYSEILTRMSMGLGDDARSTARSLSTSRRRAVRADRAEVATS